MDAQVYCKIVVEEGPVPGREFELFPLETIIGRDASADLTIQAPVVSRHHARIVRQQGQYFLEDLGSSNGTFLNGKRLEKYQALAHDDVINLGQSITLRFVDPVAMPAAARGSTILKSVNSPGRESTSMVPACCLTMMS